MAIELAQFFQLATEAMCVLSADGRCCQVNGAFEEILGYGLSDVCDRAFASLAHPDDQAKKQAVLTDLLSIPSSSLPKKARFTGRYLTKSGDCRWLEWTIAFAPAQPHQNSGESPAFFFYCMAHDVTQRHRAWQESHQFKAQLKDQVSEHADQLATAQDRYQALLQIERQATKTVKAVKAEALRYADVVRNMQVGIYIWQLETSSGEGRPIEARAAVRGLTDKGTKDQAAEGEAILRLIATNPAAERFTGVDGKAFIGKTLLEAFPKLANTEIPQIYVTVARSGEPYTLGEVPYEDDRIKKSTFFVKAFPLPEECVGISFENITERKRSEQNHQEQEDQLRLIFDRSGVGMAQLSLEGHWIKVNQCLCEMLGYAPEMLMKKTLSQVTHPDDITLDQTVYAQLVSRQQLQRTFEKRYLTQSGEVVWTCVTMSPACDRDGNMLYFIATIQDITQRKTANIALQKQTEDLMTVNMMLTDTLSMLEQRNQELDQFAYVTSHDLKAPLRAIVNLASWIEEDLGGNLPDENKQQFELLKSRVHRMEGLINGLLEYSRVGRIQQTHERVDVADLLANVVDSLSPLGGFSVEIAPEMPTLQTKKVLLIQLFSNLITNAIKHHHRPTGTVKVSMREIGAFYEFSIADDGPGIAPVYHDKIFTIFQTLKSRDDLESTGIGLSLVKKIVTGEGGTVTLDSDVGRGATFRFTWPKEPRKSVRLSS